MNYLIEYQKQLSLLSDGVIGQKTMEAISKDLDIPKIVLAHLLGQMKHESMNFSQFRENLNYSADRLLAVFPKYYRGKQGLALAHARKPELIANHVYANRMGNGDEESGDGWIYRGIFGLQLTGKTNIKNFFRFANLPEYTNPDSLSKNARLYFLAGKFWFQQNKVDRLCVDGSTSCITKVSKMVNLGTTITLTTPNGLPERIEFTKEFISLV